MEYIVEVIIAALALVGTLGGSYMANKETTALIAYRLEQLEYKVNKHNQVIERTYKLEEHEALMDEKIRVANNRIDDLEKFHKPH
jgi:type VI protein secretion system component VasK